MIKSIIDEYVQQAVKKAIEKEDIAFKKNVVKNAISMGYTNNQQLALLVSLPVSKIMEIRKHLIINKE